MTNTSKNHFVSSERLAGKVPKANSQLGLLRYCVESLGPNVVSMLQLPHTHTTMSVTTLSSFLLTTYANALHTHTGVFTYA